MQALQGALANYIPELAKGNINDLGIYVQRSDGRHYQVGDYKKRFTIQSVVKPILLLQALLDNGEEFVRSRIGVEATGKPSTPSTSPISPCSAST